MKSSAEFKKEIDQINSKLNVNTRLLRQKEEERKDKKDLLTAKHDEKKALKLKMVELSEQRPLLNVEIAEINTKLMAKVKINLFSFNSPL